MQTYRAGRVLRADRGGSSWPVLIETGDGIFYTKLRGAAQAPATLVAEIVVGGLADALSLPVPARVLIDVPPDVHSDDRHGELAQLLRFSVGLNLGFEYLPDARPFHPLDVPRVEDGILRRFDELEDLHFVVELLDLSPERAEELEEGDDLTEEEAASLADAVAEQCFQDDGHNPLFGDVARIDRSDGFEAYVAQTLEDTGVFQAPENGFVAVCPSLEKAKQALKQLGYIDGEDFRRRYPAAT